MSNGKRDSFDVLKSVIESMMTHAMEDYLNSEEPSRESTDDGDATDPNFVAVQERFNQLQERYITLKTITESLKEQISSEKEQWRKELRATAEAEAQMKRNSRRECGDRCSVHSGPENRKRMELFRDFLVFQRATDNLESITWRNNYQNWLSEVESECNEELLKIKESISVLKPLKELASRWGKHGVQSRKKCTCGAAGDASEEEVETVPVKETNELKIDENGIL